MTESTQAEATSTTTETSEHPILLIGDVLEMKPHITFLVFHLKDRNGFLEEDRQIRYVVCESSVDVLVSRREHGRQIRVVLIGPELDGNHASLARQLATSAKVVLVHDPESRPLHKDPLQAKVLERELTDIGVTVVKANEVNDLFYVPIIDEYLLSDPSGKLSMEDVSPEERARLIDKRLQAEDKFPSLPETQRRVQALSDTDPAAKWAEAIEPDLPLKGVILKMLNSSYYSFRSRVESIEQAVSLAGATAIREIVLACSIRNLFSKVPDGRIEHFWKHSTATAFFTKLFTLPAEPEEQTKRQQMELEKFQLSAAQLGMLREFRLWERFQLEEDDDPFTAGLLHDIGKITLTLCFEESIPLIDALVEEERKDAKKKGETWASAAHGLERFLLADMDHQVIGDRLARSWELSPNLRKVICEHHSIRKRSPDLVKVVALADLAANLQATYPVLTRLHPFSKIQKRLKALGGDMSRGEKLFYELGEILEKLDVSPQLWETVEYEKFFCLAGELSPRIAGLTQSFLAQTS